jgi:hypothetical protein
MDKFFPREGRGVPPPIQLYVTSLKYEQERDISATDKQESNATKIDIPIENENNQQELTDQQQLNVTEVDIPTENESCDQESKEEILTISVPNVTELWNVQKRSWVVLGLFIVICIIGYFTNKIGKARKQWLSGGLVEALRSLSGGLAEA